MFIVNSIASDLFFSLVIFSFNSSLLHAIGTTSIVNFGWFKYWPLTYIHLLFHVSFFMMAFYNVSVNSFGECGSPCRTSIFTGIFPVVLYV